MAGHSVRKKCRDCKKARNGTPGKAEWCDCGGELTAIPYGRQRRRNPSTARNPGRTPRGD